MDDRKEQVRKFEDELAALVIRYGHEFPEVTIGDVIGILEKEKFIQLCRLHRLVQRQDIEG
jgi:hypothetical protein